MYEIKKGKPFYYPLQFLKLTYNIPRSFENPHLKDFLIKYTMLTLCCLFVLCVMPVLHMVMSIKDDTGVDISEDLSISIGDTGCLLIGVLFTAQYKQWSDFFTEVTIIKKFNTRTNIEKFIKNSNLLSIIFLCYLMSGIGLYGATSIIGASSCKQLNEEKGLHESCSVICPVWFPFDTNNILITGTIFIVQLIVVLHVVSGGGMVCFIVFESAEVLVLHINILKQILINIFDESSNQEIIDRLRFCVDYHNRILRLGTCFNKLQKYTVGHLSFITALVLASILNQMQNTKPLGALMYLLGSLIAISLICHAGQRITDQTISIADAVYASNWSKADSRTIKDLSFMIMRSQKPIYLHGIPFGIYNYALFVMILKTSYSYLTLLDGAT